MLESFKNWFSPKPTGVSHVMTPPDNTVTSVTNTHYNWRVGMWVVDQDKIAILYAFSLPSVELHYVSAEDGTTILIDTVPLSRIRQAKYYEIPEVRRVNFPIETAQRLGYGT